MTSGLVLSNLALELSMVFGACMTLTVTKDHPNKLLHFLFISLSLYVLTHFI
jgi:hypothetical protein